MKISIIQGAFLPVPTLRGGAVEKIWHRMGREFSACGAEVVQISRLCDRLAEKEIKEGVNHLRIKGYDTPKSMLWLKVLDGFYSLRAKRQLDASDVIVTNTFWSPILLRDESNWGRVVVDFQRMPKGQVRFYKHVACIRVNSKTVEKAVLDECPEVAPIVRLIPNPLPFSPPVERPFESKEKVLLYAGRVHPEKGLDLLATAWKKLSPLFRDWTLEIAGPHTTAHGGGGEGYLKTLREQFGSAAVHWHGPVNEPGALEQLYRRAAIFVYPSVAEKGETFGLAPLEAMAYGAVPIVSALECFQEFLNPDANGLTFNHRNPQASDHLESVIQRLILDEGLRQSMAELAFERAKAFAPEVIAQQFLELFEELTEANART